MIHSKVLSARVARNLLPRANNQRTCRRAGLQHVCIYVYISLYTYFLSLSLLLYIVYAHWLLVVYSRSLAARVSAVPAASLARVLLFPHLLSPVSATSPEVQSVAVRCLGVSHPDTLTTADIFKKCVTTAHVLFFNLFSCSVSSFFASLVSRSLSFCVCQPLSLHLSPSIPLTHWARLHM